jgi:SAM-dependent methyltransferase
MPQRSEPERLAPTVAYYEGNADRFVAETAGVDISPLYEPFLARIPGGGRILDAGCGSGRDTKAFLTRGYDVQAFDASPTLARMASSLAGVEVAVLRFQDVAFDARFDGIWACASLLHVPMSELGDAVGRLIRALVPGGILYASFKSGEGERREGGRHFTDFTPRSIERFLSTVPGVRAECIWETSDLRPGAIGRWVNVLLRKFVGAEADDRKAG